MATPKVRRSRPAVVGLLVWFLLGASLSLPLAAQAAACDQDSDGYEGAQCGGMDCDDDDPDVYPGAPELDDGKDNDCDGTIDEGIMRTWYRDADSDTYGDAATTTDATTRPSGYVEDDGDCDDTRADVYPGAPEVADGVDNDCDGEIDEGTGSTWYGDADGDTYGDPANSTVSSTQPSGYVADGTDCDDTRADVYPGAPEVADGVDNDCDGEIDEGTGSTWYRDADGDAYGDPAVATTSNTQPSGYIADGTDCDDTRADVYPGAPELADGVDNDCDGLVDEGIDQDGDGIVDEEDNCRGVANPDQADLDGDGKGDVCDSDMDGDHLSNGDEVTHGTDPRDRDTDGDGLPDGREVWTHRTDPLSPDTDGDGLFDSEEIGRYGTDPRRADPDGDGLTDYEEVLVYFTLPWDPDTDNDWLSDGDEVHVHGTDPRDRDSDGDLLFDDGAEVRGGSDPNDFFSVPTPLGPQDIPHP